jgi:hypothetical protein
MSQPDSFVRAFNQTRQVSHNEASTIANIHNTEIRCNRREMIGSDLWLRSGYNREQCRFTYARESDQANISHDLQFQNDPTLLALFSMLSEFRSWIIRRREADISASPAPASGYNNLLTMACQVSDDFLRIIINNNGAWWDSYDHILSISAVLALVASLLTAWRLEMALVTEVHQRTQTFIYAENNVSPFAAVSASRTTFWNILFTSESNDPVSAVAPFYIYFRFIYKHAFTSFVFCTEAFSGTLNLQEKRLDSIRST